MRDKEDMRTIEQIKRDIDQMKEARHASHGLHAGPSLQLLHVIRELLEYIELIEGRLEKLEKENEMPRIRHENLGGGYLSDRDLIG